MHEEATMITKHKLNLAGWCAAYLPDFSKLNLITRYTDGIAPLAPGEFLGLFAYGVLFTLAALSVAIWRFRSRSL